MVFQIICYNFESKGICSVHSPTLKTVTYYLKVSILSYNIVIIFKYSHGRFYYFNIYWSLNVRKPQFTFNDYNNIIMYYYFINICCINTTLVIFNKLNWQALTS